MKKVGLFYGSDGGTTQEVAQKIASMLGECDVFDVSQCSVDDVNNFENLILATPTYGSGDLQDDWDDFLSKLNEGMFAGKNVALVGLGDQDIYSDTFCGGLSYLYQKASKQGKIVGQTSTDGYTFDDSEAVVDGKFVGLVIDEVNQEDMTEQRIKAWVEVLKDSFA